ncbi:TWiK family of potassium channels protein 12 [Sitophilus oryzae]|uniref:TWiK family of potassium channels protein 12 n=1 Tax=Sitophilus oryzae TaxID=7048 RepID=A0A6J2XXG6_SITOR|nr:TWiK family of potassium channels protein 12 [Sitophilus oryzae]
MDGPHERHARSVSRSRTPTRFAYAQPRQRRKHRETLKDCCKKIVAFMCTQVGVGALLIGYTVIGAVVFTHLERRGNNTETIDVEAFRNSTVKKLFLVVMKNNILDRSGFNQDMNKVLKVHQDQVSQIFKHGYDERPVEEIWTFPAALMFCLSIITMVGYGNMVPKTFEGKILTMVYAIFGLPLYILYFRNMGTIFAGCFKWTYRRLYECSTEKDENRKKIIVPSTACLWVIFAYILTGAIMFSEWEHWDFLDSTYFCVTSLCKIGFGDLVPGADVNASNHGNQTKIVINFLYMLLGLGLIAMCYNLMREEIRVKLKEMNEDFNQCLEDTKIRFLACCKRCRKRDLEYEDY